LVAVWATFRDQSIAGLAVGTRATMLCGGGVIMRECVYLMYWKKWHQAADDPIYQMPTVALSRVSQLETRVNVARCLYLEETL
jgi:hypothetical protein